MEHFFLIICEMSGSMCKQHETSEINENVNSSCVGTSGAVSSWHLKIFIFSDDVEGK